MGQQFAAADTEQVTCPVCDDPGRLRLTVRPFGVRQCPHCALVFVSPRLHADARQRFYDQASYFEGSGAGSVYGQSALSPAMILQKTWTGGRLAMVARRIPPPARLLEIGSAYGMFLAAADRAGYQVRGVELSQVGAERTRANFGFEVFCGELADSPADAADVVCAFDTIEHVPDPLVFLRQVRQRLAPNGLVMLSLPSYASWPAQLLGRRWWTLKPAEHITHFTPQTLGTVAARAGLAVTEMVSSPLARANFGRVDSMVALLRQVP